MGQESAGSGLKIEWLPLASANRLEQLDYIAQDNPSAALALDELLSEKAARLIDHPQFGRPGRIIGTRELVAHRNYILVYDVTADTVRVLRVLHAARQWPPQKA